jgi:hypothetical protein
VKLYQQETIMPVDSDPNDGFTESAQKKDPIVASDIARNMQECLVRVPIPLLVVATIWRSGCLENGQFGK